MAWDDVIKQALRFNRSQPSVEEDELAKNMCPYDAWPLDENDKGQKACPVCGRIFNV